MTDTMPGYYQFTKDFLVTHKLVHMMYSYTLLVPVSYTVLTDCKQGALTD